MPTSTPEYSDDQIAQLARQTLAAAKKADKHNRDAYTSNYQFLNLSQWDPRELERRQNKRLVLTADQLNAPVDQVVNGVRQNRPGPKVMPEGGGSDIYDADIMEGVMRRVDYENSAWNAWELATECATGGNFGCFEMGLEYQDSYSFSRRITVSGIPNANECVWFDPEAIQRDRSDAEWAHRVYFLSPEKYLQMFGRETKLGKQIESRMGMGTVLKYIYSLPNRGDYSGWVSNDVIQVSKFYRVDRKYDTLRQYTDGVERLDSEKKYITNGAKPLPGGLTRETEIKEFRRLLRGHQAGHVRRTVHPLVPDVRAGAVGRQSEVCIVPDPGREGYAAGAELRHHVGLRDPVSSLKDALDRPRWSVPQQAESVEECE